MSAPVVAVIGTGRMATPQIEDQAAEAGAAVAAAGAVLVTGGLGGVMAAAARGALDAGGTVVGLVPHGREQDAFDEGDAIVLRTDLTVAYRNALTASIAQAGVVLPGRVGTMQEAMVMLERDVPLFGYGTHAGFHTFAITQLFEHLTTDPAELADALGAYLTQTARVA